MWLRSLVLGLALLTPSYGSAQEQPPPAKSEPNYEFFSGTVEEVNDTKITVSRVLPGKPTETRSFLINPETKVEGRPRAKARVTVGFETKDDGDVAIRIIVRSQQRR